MALPMETSSSRQAPGALEGTPSRTRGRVDRAMVGSSHMGRIDVVEGIEGIEGEEGFRSVPAEEAVGMFLRRPRLYRYHRPVGGEEEGMGEG